MDTIYTVMIKEKLEDYCENIPMYGNFYKNEWMHDMLSFSNKKQLLKYLNEIKNTKVESKLLNEEYKSFIRQLVGVVAVRNGIFKSSDEIWRDLQYHHKTLIYNARDIHESEIDRVNGVFCIVCEDLRGSYKLNYPTPNSDDHIRVVSHLLTICIYKNDLVHNDTERVEHQLVKNLEEN